MSADDQAFLDVLNAVPHQVKLYSNDVMNYINDQVDFTSKAVKQALASSTWLPESIRPRLPEPAPMPCKAPQLGLLDRAHGWILRNKVMTGTFVVGIGISAALVYQNRRSYSRKRRAKRASNGARLEVVVLAGSPSEPAVRSVAQDLERRGFIVFVVCSDVDEEIMVQSESRSDIRPLTIDVSDPQSSSDAIDRFARILHTPQHAYQGARPHHLIFSGLVLIPTLTYPSAPIATLSPTRLSDIINTRLLHPILLVQSFLPLLTSPPSTPAAALPRVLLLTPSIISSINPPFHAPESTIAAALTAFSQTLTAELRPLGIHVTHLRLGAFDFSFFVSQGRPSNTVQSQRAETLTWAPSARDVYAANFMSVMQRGPGSSTSARKGSPLRELHNAVFDAVTGRSGKKELVHVGQGSKLYGFVGSWVPRGLVAWMMGVRRVERNTGLGSDDEEASIAGFGGSDFVDVYSKDGRSFQ